MLRRRGLRMLGRIRSEEEGGVMISCIICRSGNLDMTLMSV